MLDNAEKLDTGVSKKEFEIMAAQKQNRDRRGTCVICGAFGSVTRDHIPPKALFTSPLPSDLLTIPACRKCNGDASGDDEYFRNAICMSTYRGDDRHGIAGSEKAIRSIKRSNTLRKEFTRTAHRVQVVSPRGIIERNGLAFTVDAKRINRVIKRIYRGIYCFETGEILSVSYDIHVDTPESYACCDAETKSLMMSTVLEPLNSIAGKSYAEGHFRYRFARPDTTSAVSVCVMVFYNRLEVLCLADTDETPAPAP